MIKASHRVIFAGAATLCLVGVVVARERILSAVVRYPDHYRTRSYGAFTDSTSPAWKDVHEFSTEIGDPSLEELIGEALGFTSRHLAFDLDSRWRNPDSLALHRQAHCVGYASFFHAVLSELISECGLDGIEIDHAVGRLHVLGVDVHRFFRDPAFVNHDFIVVRDTKRRATYTIDPSLHDLAGIGIVAKREDMPPNPKIEEHGEVP